MDSGQTSTQGVIVVTVESNANRKVSHYRPVPREKLNPSAFGDS